MDRNRRCRGRACSAPAIIVVMMAVLTHAQTPAPMERMSFQDAVKRAVDKNPSSAVAAANILRADALLAEARAGTRLQINGNLTTTTKAIYEKMQ